MKRLYENAIYYEADAIGDIDMDSLMAFLSYHEKNMLSLQKMMPKVFECKTCNRRFPSFQALGGHRASHKKPRMAEDGSLLKPKLHECSICGLEFAVGQALGGHMRRHRPLAHGVVVKKQEGEKKLFCFDLNEPALSDEEETTDSGIVRHDHQFDRTDTSPIAVDCVL